MALEPLAAASQWEGSATEVPDFTIAYLVLSGGVYAVDDAGPATAALVYDSGTNTLAVDSDPAAVNAVRIRTLSTGGPLTLSTD